MNDDVNAGLDFRPLELTDQRLAQYRELLLTVFPDAQHFTPDYIRWEYTEHPLGPCVGCDAFDGEKLVGHCVAQPARARLFGAEEKGLLSFKSATHPDYQRRSIYSTIGNKMYDWAIEDGCAFGIGVTNTINTLVFNRKLGFDIVAPLDVRIGVGPIARRAASGETPLDFEKLWTKDSLHWRIHCPTLNYRAQRGPDRTQIQGSAFQLGVRVVMAQLANDELPDDLPDDPLGANPARLYVGLDPALDWKRSLYLRIPMKLRPSPLNFVFRDLTDKKRKLDPKNVLMRPIDFDNF